MSPVQTSLTTALNLGGLSNYSSEAPNDPAEGDGDIRLFNRAVFVVLACSLSFALFSARSGAIGSTLLWSIASVAAGAAVGFLFGIPRVAKFGLTLQSPSSSVELLSGTANGALPRADGPTPDASLRPNTNLEEVSDWLTKIIVGLSLVHLQDLQAIVANTASNAAASMAPNPVASDISIATALIIAFAIQGFFGGYIYTRLFLQGAFARSDGQLVGLTRSTIEKAIARAPADESTDGQKESLPSPAQVIAANEVGRLAYNDPRAAIEKMEELSREYEQVRSSMPSGQDRTRRMSEVVGKMTVVALGAESQLASFAASLRPGDRLAAVVILKLRFDPAYSSWLAKRLVEDAPFIGFQAASALLAASRLLGGTHLEALQLAVGEANKTLVAKGWNVDPSRDRLIAQILNAGAPTADVTPLPQPKAPSAPAPT